MPTKRERRDLLKKKYYETKQKAFILFAVLFAYIVLFGLLVYGILTGNINLTVLMVIIIIFFIPVSIFVMDSFTFEVQ